MEYEFDDFDEEQLSPVTGTVRMEWRENEIQVLMLDQPEFPGQEEAFSAGPDRYGFYQSEGSVPVAIWTFVFPNPIGLFEVNFDCCLLSEEEREAILAREHEEITFLFSLHVGDYIHQATMKLDPLAREAFFRTLKRQLQADYSKEAYNTHLKALYSFEPEELFAMGQQFSLDPDGRAKPNLRLIRGGQTVQ